MAGERRRRWWWWWWVVRLGWFLGRLLFSLAGRPEKGVTRTVGRLLSSMTARPSEGEGGPVAAAAAFQVGRGECDITNALPCC